MDIKLCRTCNSFAIRSKKSPNGYIMDHLHYHNCYELFLLEEGHREILIRDKFYQVYPQDAIMHSANTLHRSYGTKSYSRTCIYFTEEFLGEYFTEKSIKSLLRCFEKDVISLDKETFFKIQKLMAKLKKSDEAGDYSHIFVYLGDILTLLNDHSENTRKEPPFYSKEKITAILSYITDHYMEITSVEEIANHFYISSPHLCRSFKKYTGMTITYYINHVKIQQACELLARTDKPITEIAMECGFNSSMYFCKTFKAQIGITPTEFRNTTT